MVKRLVTAPLYQQLNQLLRDLIRAGEFEVNDQFLTERQICERFGVSRATANKALSNLVAEGVLEFRKGVGTFIRGGILDYDLRALVSFSDKALAAGKIPSTRVLKCEQMPAAETTADISARLHLGPADRLYYVERLRLANETPVILERRYIVERFCPDLSEADLAGSLYAVWIERCRLDIIGADQTIRAVAISDEDAGLLQVPGGAAGLLVSSVGYVSGDSPLWWEQTLYRGDAYEFRNRLGPIQTIRPAAGALLDFE
ncbi:MAG: GntR family transcriptional regulator [Chloroflexota bacterium]